MAARLIRYYEQQGLLTAQRAVNGYRTYTEAESGPGCRGWPAWCYRTRTQHEVLLRSG